MRSRLSDLWLTQSPPCESARTGRTRVGQRSDAICSDAIITASLSSTSPGLIFEGVVGRLLLVVCLAVMAIQPCRGPGSNEGFVFHARSVERRVPGTRCCSASPARDRAVVHGSPVRGSVDLLQHVRPRSLELSSRRALSCRRH